MVSTSPNLRSIVDHDGAVILDIDRDQFFSLNPVGTYIWNRIVNGETPDQIAKALAMETGVDIPVVIADVDDFLADLKSKHLVHFAAS
jgi:hypothetical protein